MRVQMNKEPTCFKLYKRLHQPKGKPSRWFNDQQGRIVKMYRIKIVERQSKSQSDEGSSQHSTQHSDNVVYLDVVDGINNKGQIYGLGSQARNVLAASFSSRSSTFDGVSASSSFIMNAKIEALSARLQ